MGGLMTRRDFLAAAALGARLRAATPLDVAYAGSMASVMEGPIRRAAATELDVILQGHAQGASGLAQLIVGGTLRPDVFLPVTPSPMETVLKAGMASDAQPIARTEMAIAYSPGSRFRERFERAARGGSEPWWRILEEPGLRFGRTDPVTDPQGRNIIFVMQLAARLYGRPDLVRRVLGADLNNEQIFTEPSVEARLQSGELDAASAYKIQPAAFGLPYIALPPAINLASDRMAPEYAQATVTLNGRVYHPEPLVYYAAALKGAPHGAAAAAFVKWLQGNSAQQILRKFAYDPPGDARPLGG
jgi:molybdate/tungstate transport system substrate-binding protein